MITYVSRVRVYGCIIIWKRLLLFILLHFFFCSFLLVYDVVVMLLLFSTLSIHDSILLFTLHIVHCLTMSATVSFLRSIRDVFPSRKSFVFFNSWQLLKAITNNKTQFVCLPFSFHLPHVIVCFILYKLDASLKTYTHTHNHIVLITGNKVCKLSITIGYHK